MQTVAVTFFPNASASLKTEGVLTLRELAERIRRSTAPRKDYLPWLKLARFGNCKTDRGSLRHDLNLLAVSGIEADYDTGQITVDHACGVLEQQGVTSVVYTSPSHREDVPRWRVLCPLSVELQPANRNHYLGRLNGLLRGIIAPESWTLSQSYYYGSVNQNPSHRVEVIDGIAIDQHDDLDEIWLGKPGTSALAAQLDLHVRKDTREDSELLRRVVTGEGYHVELAALTARYVGRGIPTETVEELLRGVMLSHEASSRDERWRDRYNSIPDLVASAANKFRKKNAEGWRALAGLACRMIREARPAAEIRAAVAAEASTYEFDSIAVSQILAWAARVEGAKLDA